MAKEYSRTQRIGDQMQRELAQLIRREVKDPRVGLVTITAVEVSLRMQLAREMKLRSVPQLHFHYDESVVRGAHLSALIERAVAEDNQHVVAAPEDTKE
jgi:ribosome-binding factor A